MNIKKHITPLFASLMIILIASVCVQATPQDTRSDSDLSSDASLRHRLQALDTDQSSRYVAAFKDLNGDGGVEAIVYMIGPKWCGSGGCTTKIFKKVGGSWKLISSITLTRLPIRVLEKKTHGWHAIGVLVAGGGVDVAYNAELDFDGKSYPRNPSLPSIKKLDAPNGEIVISSVKDARPIN
jgi:hypothetical protein